MMIKKLGRKNNGSYLLTISGSWSSSWKVFSTSPFMLSMNLSGQNSHVIMELRYGTVLLIVWLWYSYREAEIRYLVPG